MQSSPITRFTSGGFQANSLVPTDVPALQRFFEENPEYFFRVNGEPPRDCEAQEEFDALPPAEMSFNEKWLIGFTEKTGKLVGFAGILSEILAAHVWHIGIFIVATPLHGTGVALSLYEALESWMESNGARWVRLGVVEGNVKAEHFWRKLGYSEVRKRIGIQMGSRTNTVRILVKPLSTSTIAQYLSLVERDNPNSVLE
jgi:RimJ/RimL family protein N-acetyltransferase